jgi:hypothetical protein
MKLALRLVVLAVTVAGCLGGGGHAAPSSAVPPPGRTNLRISYPVGRIVRFQSTLPSCPSSATCRDVRVKTTCGAGLWGCSPTQWVRVAVRHLTCVPDNGDYADPDAACAALADLERRSENRKGACSCPAMFEGYPQARVIGRFHNRQLVLSLDFCSLCGLGAQAAHDAGVLMPK